jgi:hypothetical protein
VPTVSNISTKPNKMQSKYQNKALKGRINSR